MKVRVTLYVALYDINKWNKHQFVRATTDKSLAWDILVNVVPLVVDASRLEFQYPGSSKIFSVRYKGRFERAKKPRNS